MWTRDYATSGASLRCGIAGGGSTLPTPVAKAKAAAEGHEVEDGIRTSRAIGTCSTARLGRRRPLSGFTLRLRGLAVTATEADAHRCGSLPPATPRRGRDGGRGERQA